MLRLNKVGTSTSTSNEIDPPPNLIPTHYDSHYEALAKVMSTVRSHRGPEREVASWTLIVCITIHHLTVHHRRQDIVNIK